MASIAEIGKNSPRAAEIRGREQGTAKRSPGQMKIKGESVPRIYADQHRGSKSKDVFTETHAYRGIDPCKSVASLYSYRNASTGSSLEARNAGTSPLNTPTMSSTIVETVTVIR